MATGRERVERRLAAILATDVAGYSRLMEEDEVETLRILSACREVMDRLISEHGGRIANTAGDSVLAEFPSAVDAVQCAVGVQEAITTASEHLEEQKRVQFRIGIHVGDVMVRGGDLLGDGVNIAARLESLAEPGGVCISGDAHRHVRKALPLTFTDLGLQPVKNIVEPIHAHAVNIVPSGPQSVSPRPMVPEPLPLPDKPSIAVLPFSTPAGDAQTAFAGDGFVEDLIAAVSRNPQLFVIARNSSFTYKDRSADARQIARDLGVRYILEGGLRSFGDQYRMNVQLVDGLDGHHIWADRYDVVQTEFFDKQDAVLRSVAASVQTHITIHEGKEFYTRPKHPQRSAELLKEAWARIYQLTPQALNDAMRLAELALEHSPESNRAHQVLAICHHHLAYLGYADDWTAAVERAYRESCRAVDLYEPDEYSHWILGSTWVLK